MTEDIKTQLLNVSVTDIEHQGKDIVLITLADTTGAPLPEIKAGAHIDIHLDDNLIRQYSLCHDPCDNLSYRIGVLKEQKSRGGSLAIHRLKVGDNIWISQPKNLFSLVDEATHSILIGGGIGITPIVSMAYSLANDQRSFEIHYCSRDRETSAFITELESEPFNKGYSAHFKAQGGNHRESLPPIFKEHANNLHTHIYVCGPEPFMNWVISKAEQVGFKSSNIHKEYFQVDLEKSGKSFEVVAQKSGVTIQVGADESIVEALSRHNIKTTVSCEQGICGACLCDVLEGTPDHRDLYLTDEEKSYNDLMAICCSRAKTDRLVLDI